MTTGKSSNTTAAMTTGITTAPTTVPTTAPTPSTANAYALQPDVEFGNFTAIDMRVGRIIKAVAFPEAKIPAYKLVVDFGPLGTRQTSAQITRYSLEELQDRLVVGAMNLGVKRVAGFRSEFLVLAAVDSDNQPYLLTPDVGASPGDRVG